MTAHPAAPTSARPNSAANRFIMTFRCQPGLGWARRRCGRSPRSFQLVELSRSGGDKQDESIISAAPERESPPPPAERVRVVAKISQGRELANLSVFEQLAEGKFRHLPITDKGEVVVGDHTVISQDAYLCAGTHDYTRHGTTCLFAALEVATITLRSRTQQLVLFDVALQPLDQRLPTCSIERSGRSPSPRATA